MSDETQVTHAGHPLYVGVVSRWCVDDDCNRQHFGDAAELYAHMDHNTEG